MATFRFDSAVAVEQEWQRNADRGTVHVPHGSSVKHAAYLIWISTYMLAAGLLSPNGRTRMVYFEPDAAVGTCML